jgi:hypothetical protein
MKSVIALCAALLFALAAPAGAATAAWSDADLARASDVVLSGKVIDVAAGWDADTIYTYVTIAVDAVVKGWVPERRVTLKQLGGRVDDLALLVDDQAWFTRGEDVVVFLSVRPRDRTLMTTSLWQGKWTIARDAQSGEPLATRWPRADSAPAVLGIAEARSLSVLLAAGRSVPATLHRRDMVVDPREARTATAVKDVDATRFFRSPRIAPVQAAATSCFTQLRSAGRWSAASEGCGEIDRGSAAVISGTWVQIGATIEALKAGSIGPLSGVAKAALTQANAFTVAPEQQPSTPRSSATAPATAVSSATVQTTRVSVTSEGTQLGGDSRSAAISPDGRYVAFTFNGSILGLHDNQTGRTSAIGAIEGAAQFTTDGRYVIYLSPASRTGAAYDVTTGATRTLNVPSAVVTDDLRYAAFSIPGPFDVGTKSFVRDLQTGQDTLVPAPVPMFQNWHDVSGPVLSPTGRYVAYFHVNSPPMFLGRRAGTYVWDRVSGNVVRMADGFPIAFTRDERSLLVLSATCLGFCPRTGALVDLATATVSSLPVGQITSLAISANGRFVTFIDAVGGLDNPAAVQHAYVLDRTTGQTQQADVSTDGLSANANASDAAPDDSGRVAYTSNATNLVPRDTNGTADVFLATSGSATALPGRPLFLQSTVSPAAGSTSLVVLQWNAPAVGAPPTTYLIEAGSAPGLRDVANVSTNNSGTTFSATASGPAVLFVRIRAGNAAGVGEPSNEVTVRIGMVTSAPPDAPPNLAATVSGTTVNLTWQAPTRGGSPAGYVILAGSSSGSSDLANLSVGSGVTQYMATGVAPGRYFVRVQAFNNAGVSASSNEVVVVVAGGQPCSAPPASPIPGFYDVRGSTVTLAWQPGDGLPTSYIVEAGSAPTLADLASFQTGTAQTTLTVTGVGVGTYYVRLRARNACGTSVASREQTVVVR